MRPIQALRAPHRRPHQGRPPRPELVTGGGASATPCAVTCGGASVAPTAGAGRSGPRSAAPARRGHRAPGRRVGYGTEASSGHRATARPRRRQRATRASPRARPSPSPSRRASCRSPRRVPRAGSARVGALAGHFSPSCSTLVLRRRARVLPAPSIGRGPAAQGPTVACAAAPTRPATDGRDGCASPGVAPARSCAILRPCGSS